MIPLQTLARKLWRPTALSSLSGGALVGLYATLGIELPPGALPFLLVGIALTVPAASTLAYLRAMRRAPILRRLGRGGPAPHREELRAAVRECARLPDTLFAVCLAKWGLMAVLLSVALWLLAPGVTWSTATRVMGATLVCGPIGAMLACLSGLLACREVMRSAAARGLTLAEIREAIPRRLQLSARLVAFVAIIVVIPALMTADLAKAMSRHGLERTLTAVSPESAEAVIQQVQSSAAISLVAFLSLLFGLALLMAYVAGTALRSPLEEIAAGARRVAEGKLDATPIVPAEDELWEVSVAFSTLQAYLADVLVHLQNAGARINSTSEQMVETTGKYEERANTQAAALSQTSTTTEELARSARHISDNAGAVAAIAHDTYAAAQAGKESAEAFSQRMGQMRQVNRQIAAMVQRLNMRAIQIGSLVQFINGVADKSDLLALSAELESTKAGGVGQGFSQVAGEVRQLGQNMVKSTQEIEALIEEVRSASAAAVSATEGAVTATENGNALAVQIAERLGAIVALAGQTAEAVQSISFASQQQEAGTEQVVTSMADILRITEESLAATRRIASANRELSGVSREIKGMVERFELRGGGGS